MKINNCLILFFIFLLFACSESDETVNPDDIIKLEVYDFEAENQITSAVIGDGETILTLRATIPEDSDNDSRTVTFKASNNAMFQGVDASLDTDIAGDDGIAEVKLQMPLDDNPVFISASVTKGNNTYTSESSIQLMGVEDIVSLELLDSSQNIITQPQRADGITLISLKATVNYNQDEFDQVTFETSGGIFQGISGNDATKAINEENYAVIDLKLPIVEGRTYFRAEVGSGGTYFEEKVIDLLRAYPDEIIIEPDVLSMTEGATNTIQVYLNRNLGQVSQHTPANFKSFQLVNGTEEEVGRFTGLDGAQTDADGQITVDFKTDTNDFDLNLPVIIRVSSQNDTGNQISSTVEISLTN